MKRGLVNRLSFIVRCRTAGGENMSEQNEFGKTTAEELEKVFENRRTGGRERMKIGLRGGHSQIAKARSV